MKLKNPKRKIIKVIDAAQAGATKYNQSMRMHKKIPHGNLVTCRAL